MYGTFGEMWMNLRLNNGQNLWSRWLEVLAIVIQQRGDGNESLFLPLSVSLTVLFLYKPFHLKYGWETRGGCSSFLILFYSLIYRKLVEMKWGQRKIWLRWNKIGNGPLLRFLCQFYFFFSFLRKKVHICFSRWEPSTVNLRQSAAKALTEIPLGILEHNNKKQTSRSS